MEFFANENKQVRINTSVGSFDRSAIKTHFVQVGEDYLQLMEQYVKPIYQEGDIVSLSEKIISLCQKRIVPKSEVKISRLARFLSRFATSSTAGIGVDSVWKMQFAINHCGVLKILWASLCAGVARLFGKRGVFYAIAGPEVRGLDGFYDKSFAAYGEFGIRLPENPTAVCNEIYAATGIRAMVVDANDFERDILGFADVIDYTAPQLAEMIRDNPAGQSAQMTPFILIRKVEEEGE